MQDRFTKGILLVIAGLLVVSLFRSGGSEQQVALPSFIGSAIAQTNTSANEPTYTNYRLRSVGGQEVTDIKDIIAVGDGKSFIVSNTKGFMVYQVQGVAR